MPSLSDLTELLTTLFCTPQDFERFIHSLDQGVKLWRETAPTGVPLDFIIFRVASGLCARNAVDDDFQGALVHQFPKRAALIRKLLGDDLAHYYSQAEIAAREQRTGLFGHSLVRESFDWAAARQASPVVIERRHLMKRDFFRTAQMAIVLLNNRPKIELSQGTARLLIDLTSQSFGIYNNRGKQFLQWKFLPKDRPKRRRKLSEHARILHQALLTGGEQRLALLPKGIRQPYRWASGGTLPIVRWRGTWWCALFWRDIPPVGWNIANGASETKDEYKNLDQLIARETREELVILDRDPMTADGESLNACHLSFSGTLVQPHALETSLIKRRLKDGWDVRPGDIEDDEDRREVAFVPGPHEIEIRYHTQDEQAIATASVTNLVLSINPLEFGIEATRLAAVELEDDDYLVDGEVLERGDAKWLVRRPVALFKLAALHRTWSERRALGEDCDAQSKYLEGRRLTSLTTADVHVFAADVLARKNRRDIPGTDTWVRDYGSAFDLLLANPANVGVPDPLQVFCPAAWRVLELAFTKGMLGPDGPNMSPEMQHQVSQQIRDAPRSATHSKPVTTDTTDATTQGLTTTGPTTSTDPDERGTLPSEPEMSKFQRLHQLLLATHPDAGRLLWTLECLPKGKQLLAEISDFDKHKLGSLARRVISEIGRQPRHLQCLFEQLLREHPDHRGEIVEVAGLWGIDLSSAGEASATGVVVSAPKAHPPPQNPEKEQQASPKSQTVQASSGHGKRGATLWQPPVEPSRRTPAAANTQAGGAKPTQSREIRASVRSKIEPLLRQNRAIWTTYGPECGEEEKPESDLPEIWRRKVREIILPNNLKLRALLEGNQASMTDEELKVFEVFRNHVDDFEAKHSGRASTSGVRFPKLVERMFKNEND